MRIRTIKPEFFIHENLWQLEAETALPVRVAFAGLWCAADREGRFKWEPRRLGIQILPYDGVDFSRVLDALTTRGFVERYASESGEFGWIPSFKRHQIINNKERPSELPDPATSKASDACPTRDQRVTEVGKRKGRERNMEGKGKIPAAATADPRHTEITSKFGAEYASVTGEEYPFSGHDASALKRFLTGWSGDADKFLATSKAIITTGRSSPFASVCKRSQSIHAICQNWTSALAEIQGMQTNGKHVNGTETHGEHELLF